MALPLGLDPPLHDRAATSERHLAFAALAVLVSLSIALRLIPILIEPSLNWPDEIFQTTEQAHRLVYGTGLVPWEFQLGVRSWLLPGVIAGLMAAARILGDGPAFYQPVIATAFAALAATSTICCFLWCWRFFGLAGAIIGAAIVAATPDLVYLGARALSEVVAAHVLVLGLYTLEPGYSVTSRRRLIIGSGLLGLALILRVQLTPAIALLAIVAAARDLRFRLPAFLIGFALLITFAAVLDAVTLGAPLASIWRYAIDNVYYGVGAFNGVQPWTFYGMFEFQLWHFGIAVPILFALIGAWRMPTMLIAAATIVATHMAIAHKEYRFIYPAILLTAILAGIGFAQIVRWVEQALHRRKLHAPAASTLCLAVSLIYWGLIAFQIWTALGFTLLRNIAHDSLMATSSVARDPEVCGIGLSYGLRGGDWIYGSYTYLHRAVPRYWPKDEAELSSTAAAFNTLIYTQPPPNGLGFVTQQCFGHVCIAQRPGTCVAQPMPPLPLPDPLR
jgi:GPI mannosyltransferase 3